MRIVVAILAALFVVEEAGAAFAQDITRIISRNITRKATDNITRQIESRFVVPQLSVKNEIPKLIQARVNPAGTFMVMQPFEKSLHVWDLSKGIQASQIGQLKAGATAFGVDTQGSALWVADRANNLLELNLVSSEIYSSTRLPVTASELKVSSAGKSVIVGTHDGSLLIGSKPNNDTAGVSFKQKLNLSSDGKVDFLTLSEDGRLAAAGIEDALFVVDLETGETLVRHEAANTDIVGGRFSSDSSHFAFATADGSAWLFDQKGKVRRTVKSNEVIAAAVFSQDLSVTALSARSGRVLAYSTSNGKEIRDFSLGNADPVGVWVDPKGTRVLIAQSDGRVVVWNLETGKWLAKVFTTENGWTVLDAVGRFDGSDVGLKDVSWTLGERDLNLDSFARQYFEPGLLASHTFASGSFFNEPERPLQEGMPPPPTVEIDIPDEPRIVGKPIFVVVVARDQGGGISTLRLYHNGKLVAPGALMQQQDFKQDDVHLRATAFRIDPVVGINSLKAVAEGLWDIEGHSERHVIEFAGKAEKPTLHVVTVGINEYKDSRLNLNYSVPDATAIGDFFHHSASEKLFKEIIVHRLLNGKATKAAILEKLRSLRTVGPSDVIVFYAAGHGLVADQEWIFLPYEADYKKDVSDYKPKAISAEEIQAELVHAGARRVLVMIDSCHSGAGAEAFGQYKSFQRRFMRELSRISGITVLAASREDQLALELKTLGHGLFTYVVLEGLRGAADSSPNDGRVSAHEVVNFSSHTIDGFKSKYGIEQQPVAFALGSDFVLDQTR